MRTTPVQCRITRLVALLLTTAAAICADSNLRAAGFAEPPITFYGQVLQTSNGYSVPVTSGTVKWTIQPATPSNATPVIVSASISSSGTPGQSVYRLKIPVEKVPPGTVVSGNTVTAPSGSTSFNRGTITLNESTPLTIQSSDGATSGTFNFLESDRGKIERVDLVLSAPYQDSDGDGMPDWFEDRYSLDKSDPSDANKLDAFGRKYLVDYTNHIDPADSKLLEYQLWCQSRNLSGTCAGVMEDPDGDGVQNLVEFALDSIPSTPDSRQTAQKTATTVETFDGKRYLTMTVTKPARSSVSYVVESSSDAITWASAEGVDVVTVLNNASTLRVRDFQSIGEGSAAQHRFLRLKVRLNQ